MQAKILRAITVEAIEITESTNKYGFQGICNIGLWQREKRLKMKDVMIASDNVLSIVKTLRA